MRPNTSGPFPERNEVPHWRFGSSRHYWIHERVSATRLAMRRLFDPFGGKTAQILRAERIQRLFVDEDHAVLVRTLTRGDSQLQGTGSGVNPPVSRTPGKVERNTLNKRMRSFEILFTPATLIDPDLRVASIAHHPHRPRWSAMPSVLYSSPFRSGVDVLGPLDGLKACFGKNSSHGGSPAWRRNRVSGPAWSGAGTRRSMRRLFNRVEGEVPIRYTIGASDVVKTARSALKKGPDTGGVPGPSVRYHPDYNNQLTNGVSCEVAMPHAAGEQRTRSVRRHRYEEP